MHLPKQRTPFLDLLIGISNAKLYKDLYGNSADCRQYLDYTSSHAEHTKNLIVHSQILYFRICSFEKDFSKHKGDLKSWFLPRT